MELAAIIVVCPRPEQAQAMAEGNSATPEAFAKVPLALLDGVGRSVVHHVIDRLLRAGVQTVTELVPDSVDEASGLHEDHALAVCQTAADAWRAAEDSFSAYVADGFENILLLRLGPYAEFSLPELLRFHRDRRQSATPVQDEQVW